MCCDKSGVLIDRRELLRVKAKSLAEEARIIRKEESRARGVLWGELNWHRRSVVRGEARATYLAYGLVRGTALDRIERPGSERDDSLWKKVRGMVEKYGPVDKDRRAELLGKCKD